MSERPRAQMKAFLEEIVGRTSGGYVVLGRLADFPTSTTDPDVIEKAADVLAEKAATTTNLLTELKLRQRVLDLRRAVEALRTADVESDARRWFREHGAEWCHVNGIGYAALREIGVPAHVLADAGVSAPRGER